MATIFTGLFAVWGLVQIVLGLRNVKRQQINLGGWGHRRLVIGLPARIFGLLRMGFGLVIFSTIFVNLTSGESVIDMAVNVIMVLILYSLPAAIFGYAMEFVYQRQQESKQ